MVLQIKIYAVILIGFGAIAGGFRLCNRAYFSCTNISPAQS
ncbi:hypothetical protein CAter282_0320 [Collimonas arenae]|uniref:Uncharacterized protein n=1 Tax=Collimonas arenae TaxID=279058 RepID=A0A127PKK7_9BURK|nr:hypothetical protein CAter10_0338 [Collimonas arenae]AMP08138.1 hypothetical protein CAter282_0320 [Collimonas arenae]